MGLHGSTPADVRRGTCCVHTTYNQDGVTRTTAVPLNPSSFRASRGARCDASSQDPGADVTCHITHTHLPRGLGPAGWMRSPPSTDSARPPSPVSLCPACTHHRPHRCIASPILLLPVLSSPTPTHRRPTSHPSSTWCRCQTFTFHIGVTFASDWTRASQCEISFETPHTCPSR